MEGVEAEEEGRGGRRAEQKTEANWRRDGERRATGWGRGDKKS